VNVEENQESSTVPDRASQQMRVFLMTVRRHARLPLMRSYLKLYTTLGTERLAGFLGLENETQLKELLLMYKRTSRQLKWPGEGGLLAAERVSTTDLDFCVKENVIQVSETKVARRYGDWFARNGIKLQDLASSLSAKIHV